MFFFWYCIDDHVAALVHIPDLGHVAWWIVLVAQLMFAPANVSLNKTPNS